MIILGHRGGRGEGWPPENTLEAFSRALDEGADGVELDVRLTAADEPVLTHDPSLARLTGGRDTRPINAVRRADLPELAGGARIPRLGEALELLRGRVVNVEVKADPRRGIAVVRAVVRELERAGVGDKRCATEVVVSSFDPTLVLAFAALMRRVPVAILVSTRLRHLHAALPMAMKGLRVIEAAHLEDPLLTAPRIARLVRSELRVVAWTVNDPVRAAALARLGVGWVITDQPGSIAAMLRPRGSTSDAAN